MDVMNICYRFWVAFTDKGMRYPQLFDNFTSLHKAQN